MATDKIIMVKKMYHTVMLRLSKVSGFIFFVFM